MPNDPRPARAEILPSPFARHAGESPDAPDATLWLAGGATLLLWTAVSLLLTTA